MNKKLIAVAVGSALGAIGAPAFAQSSTVTLSGNLNYAYGYYDNGGTGYANATAGSIATGTAKVRTDGLINAESEFVLAGEERLGGGMAYFFRCATSLDLQAGAAANMCARTSYIGLKGNFGSFSFGNNDTPLKNMIAQYDPFPISAPWGQGGMTFNGVASATANAATPASFSRRQNNLITYAMPKMNGFDAAIAYTSANEATASTSATTVQKPRMWSAMLNYTNGPFSAGIGYERHNDFNPGANTGTPGGATTFGYNGGRDSSYQIGVAYTFMGSLKVSAIYNNMKYENLNSNTLGGVPPGADMSVSVYGLYANWAISGPHSVKLGYGNQGSTKGTYAGSTAGNAATVGTYVANAGAGQTGSQKIHGEYTYAMSKRTEVSLGYGRMMNDRNSAQTVGTGSNTPNFGETQTWTGARIQHKF